MDPTTTSSTALVIFAQAIADGSITALIGLLILLAAPTTLVFLLGARAARRKGGAP